MGSRKQVGPPVFQSLTPNNFFIESLDTKIGTNKLHIMIKQNRDEQMSIINIYIFSGWFCMTVLSSVRRGYGFRCRTLFFVLLYVFRRWSVAIELQERAQQREQDLTFSKLPKNLKSVHYSKSYKRLCVWLTWWKMKKEHGRAGSLGYVIGRDIRHHQRYLSFFIFHHESQTHNLL